MNQTVVTKSDGSFSVETPLAEGDWEMVAQVKGNWRYASSSSGIMTATVIPLSLGDKTLIAASMAITPPYVYILVLASGIGIVLVVRWKSDVIAPKMPKSIQALIAKIPKNESSQTKNTESDSRDKYRREPKGN